jgi:hypothetical protein
MKRQFNTIDDDELKNPMEIIEQEIPHPYRQSNEYSLNSELERKIISKQQQLGKRKWNDISIINECLYEQDR